MIKKFLYFTDSHIRSSRPACRKDSNFYGKQFEKLNEVLELADREADGLVMHGGDFFDSYDPSISLLNDSIQVLKSRTPMIINPGNHDLGFGNSSLISKCGLGILKTSGISEVLSEQLPGLDIKNVVFRTMPYQIEYPENFYWFENKNPEKFYITVAHDLLSPHWLPYKHKDIHTLKTNADLVLCSHLHSQFREKVNNTWFINPGPFDCQSVNEKEIKPAVAVIEIGQEPTFKFLNTTGYEQVEVMDKVGEENLIADAFIQELMANKLNENLNLNELILEVETRLGYSNISQIVIKKLESAKLALIK